MTLEILRNNDIEKTLQQVDSEVQELINHEYTRQKNQIELIASENFTSQAVIDAVGSILTNKYAEGYPGKRYYSGCEFVDEIENLAINRLCNLYNCKYANVQPHSGSQANSAVYLAFLTPGDTILGMSLDSGGHLTHGSKVSMSGKWFNAINYGVDKDTFLLDYNEIESLAKKHKPKMIIAGHSAYSRKIDFAKFREIADSVGAYLLVDMAHISGLVATGSHQNPVPYADFVTSTTHKTLRGPRGGIILTNNESHAKKINMALFPGSQGGPLIHVIAGKAVAFKEASTKEFKYYINSVLLNAAAMAKQIEKRGYDIVTGGTDNHLFLVDLRKHMITGKDATDLLDEFYITCNKNSIPFDKASPFVTSGIRIGTAAVTTRGFDAAKSIDTANLIADALDILKSYGAKAFENKNFALEFRERAKKINEGTIFYDQFRRN